MDPGPINHNSSLVSICMPTRNGAEFIGQALLSAFSQTYQNTEIIISDDHSEDGTLQIVEHIAKEQGRTVKIFHHHPSGIGANWNHCVEHARGSYIKFLFQDDLLEPDCIERMMAMALGDKRIGMVYCRRKILYDKADPALLHWALRFGTLHQYWSDIHVQEGVSEGRKFLRDRLLLEQPFNKIGEPTAVLLKREVFAEGNWFNTKLSQILDYIFWYQVMRTWHVGFIDAELVSFRLHPAQATQVNVANKDVVDYQIRKQVMYDLLRNYLHPAVRRKLTFELTGHGRPLQRFLHWARRHGFFFGL